MPNTGGVTVTPLEANHCEYYVNGLEKVPDPAEVPVHLFSSSKACNPSMQATRDLNRHTSAASGSSGIFTAGTFERAGSLRFD